MQGEQLTDKEKNPGQTKQGDQSCIQGNEKAKGPADVLTETLHGSFEAGTARVQHMTDMVVQFLLLGHGPSLERNTIGKDSIV